MSKIHIIVRETTKTTLNHIVVVTDSHHELSWKEDWCLWFYTSSWNRSEYEAGNFQRIRMRNKDKSRDDKDF
ncbi:hypothetical protein BY996DRAFT_6470041 [Phakopsora pachyrhizi]|nr:hypothetical protein BY996DRAFT_6617683 [Phakopsora pachyrhizi]KAI8455425.1 hypothetical protein BY996DRAFT_6470041 [Phakopsora pachyrhizi]